MTGLTGGLAGRVRLTAATRLSDIERAVDAERTIAEIELLERTFALADTRPPTASDVQAANRRHDERLAHSPWFKLWQAYGICCRPAAEHPLRLEE
ncbi:MAG TPA: hypothetical protein VFU76_14620 [Terriglobales bacterium]|nr:hypothetical protein [Terriglobales bacterium]